MKEFEVLDLELEGITVADAAIENPLNAIIEKSEESKARFSIGFFKGYNEELHKVLIKVFIEISTLDKQEVDTGIKGKFTIQFIYSVKGLNEYIAKDENGKILMEAGLNGSMLSIAYSTTRGIIFTRCLGTVLGEVVLPIVSVNDLLKISEQQEIYDHKVNA